MGSYSIIGERNRLHPSCVIGSDGYGYVQVNGRSERIPQIGFVETGANVDIGASTTIDRARIGKTIIGEGTKIDNLVQIGSQCSYWQKLFSSVKSALLAVAVIRR